MQNFILSLTCFLIIVGAISNKIEIDKAETINLIDVSMNGDTDKIQLLIFNDSFIVFIPIRVFNFSLFLG